MREMAKAIRRSGAGRSQDGSGSCNAGQWIPACAGVTSLFPHRDGDPQVSAGGLRGCRRRDRIAQGRAQGAFLGFLELAAQQLAGAQQQFAVKFVR